MARKPDIVALKWVVGLINSQAENAEAALVEFSRNPAGKQALLQCMLAVHQITSTFRALGMGRAEMLTLEMERSLNYIYRDKVGGERLKLTMGGLMQALKILPAYLAHTQTVRADTGQGLEQHVNDLRRWLGERPRPQAYFFHMAIPAGAGITTGAAAAPDEEIKSRANAMLALYLETAKLALRGRNVSQSMQTVARVARKMQTLFAGTGLERFWFALIGLCEGIAGGLIVPDECIAQIFKTGAFMIKSAREQGAEPNPTLDPDDRLQQMLFYMASCKSRPFHITAICQAFGVDDNSLEQANRGLLHMDAVVTALAGALEQLNRVVDFLNSSDLAATGAAEEGDDQVDTAALEAIEAAQYRLDAAGELDHADALRRVGLKLERLYQGEFRESFQQQQQAGSDVIRGIVEVKLDIEHKLAHGLANGCSGKEFELRESVVTATFKQMSLVENHLQQILRRKALAAALARKPFEPDSVTRLTVALNRHLNKTDQGHEQLRRAVSDADRGEADLDLLYSLARSYLDDLQDPPDRKAIELSLQLLAEIAGALDFAGMARESRVIEQCQQWLEAASNAGSVREDEAFRCFADAFAHIELHLQRSISDPLDDTAHLIAVAQQRAAELGQWQQQVSAGAEVLSPVPVDAVQHVEDGEIAPEFREVFIEEADELTVELARLASEWEQDPQVNGTLRDIRRHLHTFKGNGRAVGANILGELGWAAQDMLDRVLDGELAPGLKVQTLVRDVIAALPALVMSYRVAGELDIDTTRYLTNQCFLMASAAASDTEGEVAPPAPMAAAPAGLLRDAAATQTINP